ncbi:MAG: thioredoxin domain-containing protein [Acidobacteriota bacterium]
MRQTSKSRIAVVRAVMLAMALLSCVNSASAASVSWRDSIEEGLAQSRPSNKPMWLEFWATWCAPCKVMDAEVYTNDDVIQASRRFVPVRIDFDKKGVIARRYNVTSLPTFVFTDSDGDELFRYSGAIAAAPMAELLRSLPEDVTEFNRFSRILAADRNNFEALAGMGAALKAAGLFRTSNEYYKRALARSLAGTGAASRESVLAAMGANYLEVRAGRLAADAFARCLKEFPGSPHVLEWQLNLGRAYALDDNKAKARKYLEAFIRDHPGSPQAETARRLLEPS